MKKLMASVLALVCVVAMAGCGKSNVGDYPATIMVNGINYYSTDNAVPVEVDESVIQYTTSYAENGIPQKTAQHRPKNQHVLSFVYCTVLTKRSSCRAAQSRASST